MAPELLISLIVSSDYHFIRQIKVNFDIFLSKFFFKIIIIILLNNCNIIYWRALIYPINNNLGIQTKLIIVVLFCYKLIVLCYYICNDSERLTLYLKIYLK